jgi:hypothetical protein
MLPPLPASLGRCRHRPPHSAATADGRLTQTLQPHVAAVGSWPMPSPHVGAFRRRSRARVLGPALYRVPSCSTAAGHPLSSSPGQGLPDPTRHQPTSLLAIAPPARDQPSLCLCANLASSPVALWLKNSGYTFDHQFLVGIIQINWVWTMKTQMGMGNFGCGFGYTHTLPNNSYSTRTGLAQPVPGLHVINGARSTTSRRRLPNARKLPHKCDQTSWQEKTDCISNFIGWEVSSGAPQVLVRHCYFLKNNFCPKSKT